MKQRQACDWCGDVIDEPFTKKHAAGAPQGNWHKTFMHTECRKKANAAYKVNVKSV